VFQASSEELSLVRSFDWKNFFGVTVKVICADDVKVKIVDDAVSTHAIVADSQLAAFRHFEHLQK